MQIVFVSTALLLSTAVMPCGISGCDKASGDRANESRARSGVAQKGGATAAQDDANALPLPDVDTSAFMPSVAEVIQTEEENVRANREDAEAWGRLGLAYRVHEQLQPAIACLHEAVRRAPEDYRWPYVLGLCYHVSDRERAIEALERALELNEEHAPLYIYLGQMIIEDDVDRAEALFERARAIEPRMRNAYLGLARVALIRNNPERAIEQANLAIENGATQGEAYQLIAEAHRRLGNTEEAHANRQQAEGLDDEEAVFDPMLAQYALEMARTLPWRQARSDRAIRQGRIDEAIAEWREMAQDQPDNTDPHVQMGIIYTDAGRMDEAIEAYRTAVNVNPDDARLHRQLGRALAEDGKHEAAVKSLMQAIELDPEIIGTRDILGNTLMRLGQPEAGLAHLRKAVEVDPESPHTQFNYASALTSQGRDQEAAEVFAEAVRLDPAYVRAWSAYGTVLARLGRYDEAITACEEAIALDLHNADHYIALAQVLVTANQDARARETITEGLRRRPGHAVLRNQLAWLLATSDDDAVRDPAEALRVIESLLEALDRESPVLLDTLAAAHAANGDFAEALSTIGHAIEMTDSDPALPDAWLEGFRKREASYRAQEPWRE